MSREALSQRVERAGLLPVVRTSSEDLAVALSLALHQGGIECLEVTLTVPGALRAIERLCHQLGDTALVGAGTVLSAEHAAQCLDAGAKFLVSPGAVPGLVQLAHERDALAMPGALTPTEVMNTWREGADFVKVFPCSSLGGADYLKALKAPLPDVKLLPTGGITLETLGKYVTAGAAALGVGTALADASLLEREGADAVTALAKQYVNALSAARGR